MRLPVVTLLAALFLLSACESPGGDDDWLEDAPNYYDDDASPKDRPCSPIRRMQGFC